jgi:hypothetical protein
LPPASAAPRKPTLWLLAVGLHDNSKAFEGDVEGVEEAILRINPQAQVLALSNPHLGGDLKRPFGTRENLQRAVQAVASRVRAGDSILVFVSTHGHINRLAVSAGNNPYPDLTGNELQQLLMPLQPHATGIIVSACHSGSLIPALRAPNRWVMTAAAANRVSFGCNFFGKQTFYVQALLKHMDEAAQDLQRWATATGQTVQAMETAARVSPHSNPQLWVGSAMQQQLTGKGLGGFFKP